MCSQRAQKEISKIELFSKYNPKGYKAINRPFGVHHLESKNEHNLKDSFLISTECPSQPGHAVPFPKKSSRAAAHTAVIGILKDAVHGRTIKHKCIMMTYLIYGHLKRNLIVLLKTSTVNSKRVLTSENLPCR